MTSALERLDLRPVVHSPDNTWQNGVPKCYGDPMPTCLRYVQRNPICEICVKFFGPKPEPKIVTQEKEVKRK